KPYNSTSWVQVTDPDGSSRLMLVQDATARRFRKSTQDLRWKRLFSFDKANAKRVEIQEPGTKSPGVILNRGEDGKMILEGIPEGKAVKSADLVGITATLASLSAKDFHPRLKAKKVGLATGKAWSIRVTLTDGSIRTLLLTPRGEDKTAPKAISDGGPLEGVIVSLNPFQADKLRKSLDDLVK
ncbi:MAG: hypothetical protein VX938_04380, partial [Myxococcota bacterium]|nr:hypothetical protein [Myxococcota bacterium]